MRGLQIVLVLLIAVVLNEKADATGGLSVPRPKPKPKPCGIGCGFGAVCRANKCICRPRRVGDPKFVCFSPRFYYLCQISSDPMLTNFPTEVAGIKMPAALALTKFTTRRFGKGRGKCMFTLNGWTERFGGKYFIQALQFTLVQEMKKGKPSKVTIRIVTKVVNNKYYWFITKKKAVNNWEKISDMTPTSKRSIIVPFDGCKIRFMRLRSEFLYVNVMCCLVRFAIRPHNEGMPDIVPGIWVMLRKWAQLSSLPNSLCNNVTNSQKIDDLKSEFGFASRTQYTTFVGLAYGRPVNYPGSFANLPALQNTLTSCPKNRAGDLMRNCEFLFNFAKLIACEQDRIMNITFSVAKGFCNNNAAACDYAIQTLKTDCPDVKPNKQMKAFLKKGCL